MSKPFLVTEKNLPQIKGMIQKILNKSEKRLLHSQSFYPRYKRNYTKINRLGLKDFAKEIILNSIVHTVPVVKIDINQTPGMKDWININNNNTTHDHFYWKADVINIGSKIQFKNDTFIVIKFDNFSKKKVIEKFWIK